MTNYIVCRTPYHLLLASLLMIGDSIKGKTKIFYAADSADKSLLQVLSFLRNEKRIEEAIEFDDNVMYRTIRNNIFNIFKTKMLRASLPTPNSKSSENSYYFFVAGIFEMLLFRGSLRSKFILLEDGEAIYTQFKRYHYKEIAKKLLGFGTHDSKFRIATEIWCQNPDRLPLANRRNLPTKKICPFAWTTKSREFISRAYGIPFDYGRLSDSCGSNRTILILTQPWSEDQIVSEITKIQYYKTIAQAYEDNAQIVIKPHPRESTQYRQHFPFAIILPNQFPVEVLNYSDIVIDLGVTINSSALGNISCVREKIYLGTSNFRELNFAANARIVKKTI
jgi:hypothetical protein